MKKEKIICVVGPTASGKTALGIGIAKALGGEVVSADSMQVYKGMPIASAVPTNEEKEGIPHHLMEFSNPECQLTVAEYVKLANQKTEEIISRNKLPVIVGGTGLYIDSFLENIKFTKEDFNPDVRRELEELYDRIGGEAMLRKLKETDSATADKLYANDKKRIVRAFEIYKNTGITMSKQYELSKLEESPYEAVMIGINYKNRQTLYKRIDGRVDIMLKNGLLQEAEKFYKKSGKSGGFAAIGHKEFYPYFEGDILLGEATERLKQQTRRYAKRQLTWFRKNEKINWIFPDETPDVLGEALEIIERSRRNERA
ncbi:MAG: tRNA (adenosine(37)-N6)-dimethylallyltransferase MiaA [Clostridia bacterium]|nr:tRNA (adenosine(37)-N6)-dimethylallyltransferase MiaA [Clostridia bacterium]